MVCCPPFVEPEFQPAVASQGIRMTPALQVERPRVRMRRPFPLIAPPASMPVTGSVTLNGFAVGLLTLQ